MPPITEFENRQFGLPENDIDFIKAVLLMQRQIKFTPKKNSPLLSDKVLTKLQEANNEVVCAMNEHEDLKNPMNLQMSVSALAIWMYHSLKKSRIIFRVSVGCGKTRCIVGAVLHLLKVYKSGLLQVHIVFPNNDALERERPIYEVLAQTYGS
jgi:hypothetical protein